MNKKDGMSEIALIVVSVMLIIVSIYILTNRHALAGTTVPCDITREDNCERPVPPAVRAGLDTDCIIKPAHP